MYPCSKAVGSKLISVRSIQGDYFKCAPHHWELINDPFYKNVLMGNFTLFLPNIKNPNKIYKNHSPFSYMASNFKMPYMVTLKYYGVFGCEIQFLDFFGFTFF